LKEQISGSDRDLVISGEVLSLPGSIEILRKMKELIEPHFDKIEVISYVRPPIGFAQSDFQESVKGGEFRFNAERKFPAYKQRFEPIDSLFGRDNVSLVKYSPSTLKGGDVVQDFLSRVGVTAGVDRAARNNESLSLEATALLYAFQRYAKESGAGISRSERSNLLNFLAGFGKSKVLFGQVLRESMLRKNRSQVEWIEKRVGQPFFEPDISGERTFDTEGELIAIAQSELKNLVDERACQEELSLVPGCLRDARFSGWLLAYSGNDFSKIDISTIAARYEVDLHVLLRELARSLARLNKVEAALELIDEASRLQPDGLGIKLLKEELLQKFKK
jgi:hypothetical protein